MKKIYFVLLSLAFVFCLASCRKETTTETPTTVVTKAAPTISGAHDVELELNERYIPMAGISAVDADGNDLTDDVVYNGDVDTSKAGVYHATFSVTDSNGNTASVTITVTVVSSDKDAPVLSGVSDIEIPVTSEFDPMQGVSAIDTVDGDLTDKVQVEGTVDTKNLGTQTLKYTVTDEAGNKAERSRVVRVTEGRFVFEEVSEENKVTCDPADLNGVYTFVLIKVKYAITEAGDVTVALGEYSVTHHHDAAGEFEAYVRADEALTDQAVTLTGATFVQLMVAGCPDITAPVITGEFNQTFMVSKDHKDLAAQFVSEMAEAVARDDTDGFITKDCYMEYPEGFDWDSTEEQTAYFCAKDQAGNETKKEVKVVVAAETKLADMLPVGEGPDSGHDNNPQILMYRNMTMTKQADGTILLSGMQSGGYASHQMIKYDLSNLSYGNTYMLKLTAKFLPGESEQLTQAVGYRIGQSLDAAPWYVEFGGFSYDYFNLTPEETTTYHVFKYNVTAEEAALQGGVSGEAMEFQFGNTTYYTIYDVVLVSFELYLISNENQAPVLNRNNALPTILVKGEEAPDLTKYFTSYDVEDGTPEIVITGAVDMSKKGTYPVTFTATDSEGKTTSVTLNFEVLNEADTIAPEIKWESPYPDQLPALPEEIVIGEYPYSTETLKNGFILGLKITDKKDGETIEMAAKDASINWGGFDVEKPGKYTIRVTATDDSGNSTTESFVIKVVKEKEQEQSELTLVTELKPTESACENLSFEENDGIVKLTPTSVESAWASFNKVKYTITSNLEVGKTYRFVLEAKADAARDIAISVGGNYWPNNENLAKLICDLGTEFKTFALDFEYTGQTPTGVAVSVVELEFQAGKADEFTGEQSTTNSVYVKSFALYEVTPVEKEKVELVTELKPTESACENLSFEENDGIVKLTPTSVESAWASFNKVKYTITSNLEVGKTYRFVLEAKADAARDIAISVGGNYWPNNENLAKLICDLGTEFKTFALDFEYTGQTPTGVAVSVVELEFQAGKADEFTGEQSTTNSVYVKSFALYEVTNAQSHEEPEEPADPEGCLANALKATAYSDGSAIQMTKNEDGSYSVQSINAKWFGWKNFNVPAEAKYLVLVIDAKTSIQYKIDDAENKYDTAAKRTKTLNGEETIVYTIADVISDPTQVKKIVIWVFDETNPTITVKAAYFAATDPTTAQEPEEPETPAEPTKANLLIDFEDGAGVSGASYDNDKWSQEKYQDDAWKSMSGQMNSRTKVTKVANVVGTSVTTRYTYSDGDSLGLANHLSIEMGNYWDPKQPISMKLILIDKSGNSIYLLGSQNDWNSVPVGETLVKSEFSFDEAEIAGIRIVLKNASGNYYLYLDNIELKYVEAEEPEEPETPAEPTKANLTLDFEDGSGNSEYTSSKWAREKYNWNSAENKGEWVVMSGQMNSRTKVSKVVNVVGTSVPTRFTYSDGDSLGLANYLSIEIGNYYSGATSTNMKLILINKEGQNIYLLGGESEWYSLPAGTDLVKYEFLFAEAEIAGIRIALKEKSGSFYTYLDNITLKDLDTTEAYEASIMGKKVVLSTVDNKNYVELSCADLGVKLMLKSEINNETGAVVLKDALNDGAQLTLNGQADANHNITITSAEGSFTYKDLFVNAVFAPIVAE